MASDRFKRIAVIGVLGWGVLSGGGAWAASQGEIQKGEKVFADRKCSACHAVHGKGGQAGPDLSAVGDRRDEAWLKGFLPNPKSVFPQTIMPAFRGSPGELEALVEYLESLKTEGGKKK